MVSPVEALAYPIDATILSGESLSAAVNLAGHVLCGVYMPAAWTAAGLSFQASIDGETFVDIYSAGAELTAAAGASQYVALDSMLFLGVRSIKVRSGTAGVPVNQGADRALILVAGKPAVS